MTNEKFSDVLVETSWVADHLHDPQVRLVESDEDVSLYCNGHIPGAVTMYWIADLYESDIRNFIDEQRFAQLLGSRGITNDTLVVFYGDKHNWWATYALWVFHLFGHTNACIMNGGRDKWIAEGRNLTKDIPSYYQAAYRAPPRDDVQIRAFRDQVSEHITQPESVLIDARSTPEYTGELIHMHNYPQSGVFRRGHIPTAINIPWDMTTNTDGTFKSREELHRLYASHGVTPEKSIITYCRMGERSSHTWFVLSRLLGYPHVRNYDGSWSEWGNLVGVPVEKTFGE